MVFLLGLAVGVAGHGALVEPIPRNAIDRTLPRRERSPPHLCDCANATGDSCDVAQACYWYSQGCTIGCPTCDHTNGRAQADLCGLGKTPTLNDAAYRSVNVAAEAGSTLDIYRHNPWRAPGSAPVADACGLAGGTPWGADVSEWGDYVNTSFAKHGDRGSELPPTALTTWERGSAVNVTWQITANHGGGYSYRLCPASEPLTEACFQKHPLAFASTTHILAFSDGSKRAARGTFVNTGTLPEGSTWARNPIPARCLGRGCVEGQDAPNCEPCPGTLGSDCTTCGNSPAPGFAPPCEEGDVEGRCSGNQGYSAGGIAGSVVSVRDVLLVPPTLDAGAYVLGWRLDCEATAQVWSNCADILVV